MFFYWNVWLSCCEKYQFLCQWGVWMFLLHPKCFIDIWSLQYDVHLFVRKNSHWGSRYPFIRLENFSNFWGTVIVAWSQFTEQRKFWYFRSFGILIFDSELVLELWIIHTVIVIRLLLFQSLFFSELVCHSREL